MKEKLVIALVILSLILISGCSKPASNTIKIGGSSDLEPLMKVWASEYQKTHKDVKITVSASDDEKGIDDVLKGSISIGLLGRDATPDEVGKGIFYIPVTADAIFPIANFKNTFNVAGSKEMFQALWVNGTPIVWPNNKTVVVYTRSDSSGAADSWARYLDSSASNLKGSKVYGDKGIVESIKRDVNGVGYAGLETIFNSDGQLVDGVRVVPIIMDNQLLRIGNRSSALLSIQLGLYPVARVLYLNTKGSFSNASKDFVNWILTDGQQYVINSGYIGLSAKDLETIKSKI